MGIKVSYSAKILKKYGRDATDIIRHDPYRLVKDLPGPGFIIADTIARKSGLSQDDPKRINACITHLIEQSVAAGNVFAYKDQLLKKSMKYFQIEPDTAKKAIATLADSSEVVVERISNDPDAVAVYPKNLHEAETGIANRLRALLSVPVTLPAIDAKRIITEVQKRFALVLSSEQLAVLEGVLSHRAVIITGGPGTGKTTLIKSITAILEARGEQFLLAAPTGRAARRISEVARRKATTIHKLLGYNLTDGLFDKNQDNPLDAYAVIIDEASMVDTLLMYHLLKAVPMTSVLILVGDVFQLPPVGPGNVLADMIKSEIIPAFHLKKIFRQDQESPIVLNAHKVRRGELPELKKNNGLEDLSEFYFIEQNDPDTVIKTIVELCRERIPQRFNLHPRKDLQVLTPMHKGKVGTINLNQVLQKALNPNPALVESQGNLFKRGDKVMHLINNYQKEVFNGDIGTINSIDNTQREISVDYYGRTVPYDFEELEELSLAYAISVHKSQGSEYPGVIVPIMTQHFALLQRNLLYTAMTRGKKLVILIGTTKALTIALKNDKPQQRFSRLADRLKSD
jgi:exodeoxyribonuclease V alpha subunit